MHLIQSLIIQKIFQRGINIRKKFKALDADGMPLDAQRKLLPELSKKKYQVSFTLKNGRVRFAFTDNPHVIETYVKTIDAKILKILKIK